MSGGAWEYMMAAISDNKTGNLTAGRNNLYNSGFNGILTCPTCDSGSNDTSITEINNGIPLPIEEKYYDIYNYDTSETTYRRGKLGDATKELGPFESIKYVNETRRISSWYADEGLFVDCYDPWVIRGGRAQFGLGAGVFNFAIARGKADTTVGFRLVLAI